MILALDPSLRCTGWVVIPEVAPLLDVCTNAGVVVTEREAEKRRIFAGDDDARRILLLWNELERIVTDHPVVTRIVAEQPAGARGAGGHRCTGRMPNGLACGGNHVPGMYRSAKAEGLVLACVSLFARARGIGLTWVQPQDVKRAMLGTCGGSKDAMVLAAAPLIERHHVLMPKARDKREAICDAIGVAVAAGVLSR
jgi:Holliday junction resolvasome RuvABC endonuclease subunit